MSIFEDKKHNNINFIGQVPVTAVPEDINRRQKVGNIDRPLQWPHGVVSVPNAGENK